jgi:hypothetical protein
MTAFEELRELPDPGTLQAAATSLTTFGSDVVSAVDAASRSWAGLGGGDVYETPERETVLQAMQKPATIAAMIEQNAGTAAAALDAYAGDLQRLATRRAALVEDVAAHAATPAPVEDPDDPAGHEADVRAAEAATDDLAERVRRFNVDADAADQDCADALNVLDKYSDTVVARFHSLTSDGLGGVLTGGLMATTEEALSRWRRIAIVPADAVPTIMTVPAPDDFVNGKPVWRSPGSSLLLPRPPAPPPLEVGPGVRPHDLFVGDAKVSPGAIPTAAKWGGRALGAAGFVLTLGAAGYEEYVADQRDHPEWTTSQRAESITTATVIKGGAGVATGFAGAAAGAALGTLIFPGVGTAIGAIVGGGLASGFGAEPLGDVLTGWYEGSAAEDAVHDVWEDLFG